MEDSHQGLFDNFLTFLNNISVSAVILLLTLLLYRFVISDCKKKEEGNAQQTLSPSSSTIPTPLTPAAAVASTALTSKSPTSFANTQYRFEQEVKAQTSSEYTRRGQLWSQHPSWHLQNVPRINETIADRYRNAPGFEHVRCILRKYEVDYHRGFLPGDDPLQRLPYARYHVWEDLADDLPKLLGARLGQARSALEQLPVLSTDKLRTDADLRRAHLLLCLFAHSYIWGGNTPKDYLPEGIAKPLWEVSKLLDLPPILGHTSIVLYNWRRLDIHGDICMENLSTLNNFFDGRDESWFYLVTVEIEARGAFSIIPLLLTNDAIQRYNEEEQVKEDENERLKLLNPPLSSNVSHGSVNSLTKSRDRLFHIRQGHEESSSEFQSEEDEDEDNIIYIHQALVGELSLSRVIVYVTAQLRIVSDSIAQMCQSLSSMREGCHPFIFYHRVRPFLSGWKHNPTLPNGIIYQGVSEERFQFYGGSAAQSALIPFLDICFGIEHESNKSKDFLLAMREYMLKPHREFLQYMESIACLRPFILERMKELQQLEKSHENSKKVEDTFDAKYITLLRDLQEVYNSCVENIAKFRTGHISLVAEYIMAQQPMTKPGAGGMENNAGGKGTGGTDLMNFLKPIRDDCNDRLLSSKEKPQPIFEKDSVLVEKKQIDNTPLPSSTNASARPTEPADSTKGVTGPTSQPPLDFNTVSDIYFKDNGCIEDIDLFRGAMRPFPTASSLATSAITADAFRYAP